MQLSKNKKYQYLFFFLLSIFVILNGGNSNLLIQFNFIFISLFFLYCLYDKNYKLHLTKFYSENKTNLILYLIFLLYIIFQLIPFPINFLKLLNNEKFFILTNLNSNYQFSSISLSPSDTFFQILNYMSLLLAFLVFKMIFYTKRHRDRFNIFMSFIGFISSFVAVIFYLYGNPDFYFIKNSLYEDSSTGFFINRTVSAIFLLFCLISSLELFKDIDNKNLLFKKDNFFVKIYLRLFIIFITIGIITSFSRIANFLLLLTILFYLIDNIFFSKKKSVSFKYLIIAIILFDIVVIGFYFGTSQIVDRFYFLKDEFASLNYDKTILSRLIIAKFSFDEFKNFLIFGYGAGSYEYLFQLKFINSGNSFANHAHSDLVEFLGEFGVVGFLLISILVYKIFLKIFVFNIYNCILISYLVIILIFDFSFHVPLIQMLFVIFFSLNKKLFR